MDNAMPKTDPKLLAALEKAKQAWNAMSEGERREMLRKQAEGWAIAEAGFGSDADEAEYRAAFNAGDKERLSELDSQSEQRMATVREILGHSEGRAHG